MKKFFFFFALTGWTLGLIVHVLALSGIDTTERLPFTWVLHIGIFVVWLPAILELRKDEELQKFQKSATWKQMYSFAPYKIIFRKAPTWLTAIAICGFFYAVINFTLFSISQSGTPDIKDGQYILHSHGHLIRTLTETEYHLSQAHIVRGVSGHWLLFYGMAAAVLFPFAVKKVDVGVVEKAK